MKTLATILLLALSTTAFAKCEVRWVDSDYDVTTPPVQKQICTSNFDIPAISIPGVQPIQRPQIKPIPSYRMAPLGTTRCSNQSVMKYGEWRTVRLCR